MTGTADTYTKSNRAGAVLVVDDEKQIRELLKYILNKFGFTVLLARDGAGALKTFEKHIDEIGLVLMDINMPTMNGLEAAAEMRRRRPDSTIIFLSGHADEHASDIPATSEVIAKPFDVMTLVERICQIREDSNDRTTRECATRHQLQEVPNG